MSKVVCLIWRCLVLVGAGPLHGDSHWMRCPCRFRCRKRYRHRSAGCTLGFRNNLRYCLVSRLFPKACVLDLQPACMCRAPDRRTVHAAVVHNKLDAALSSSYRADRNRSRDLVDCEQSRKGCFRLDLRVLGGRVIAARPAERRELSKKRSTGIQKTN